MSLLQRLLPILLWTSPSGTTASSAGSNVAGVTAIEKVIQLLGSLAKDVSEEGLREAKEYDRYACFCREESAHKAAAIAKSQEKLDSLTASITKLGAEITQLDTDVGTLGGEITQLETDIGTEETSRQTEFGDYLQKDGNATKAIEAVEKAIAALQASKNKMVGDADLNLRQVQEAIATASLHLPEEVAERHAAGLSSLLQAAELSASSSSPGYNFSSNSIMSTLRELRKTFKENKADLYKTEFAARSASEKKILGFQSEKKAKEKSKAQKEAASAEKFEEKTDFEKEEGEEKKDKAADEKFKTELDTQCQTKGQEWDQRSQARSGELTVIAQATEMLKAGATSTFEANKKLVGLVAAKKAPAGPAARSPKGSSQPPPPAVRPPAVSFLQLRGSHAADLEARQAANVQKVVAQLSEAAARLKSTTLHTFVAKLELQEDHFVKVRALINDIVKMLEDQGTAEATSKGFCDTEVPKATAARDREASNMEDEAATINTEQAKKEELVREVAELQQEVADMKKTLVEAAKLREDEIEGHAKMLADVEAGRKAVDDALQLLQGHYGFVELRSTNSTSKADRDGRLVQSVAPKTSFSGDYEGKKDASKGIIGLLNTILSDFDRTKSDATAAETKAGQDYNTMKGGLDTDISTKEGSVTSKEGEITTADQAIVAAQDAWKTASDLREGSVAELDKLRPMCVGGSEESYAERRRQREQEITSLRRALEVLEDFRN